MVKRLHQAIHEYTPSVRSHLLIHPLSSSARPPTPDPPPAPSLQLQERVGRVRVQPRLRASVEVCKWSRSWHGRRQRDLHFFGRDTVWGCERIGYWKGGLWSRPRGVHGGEAHLPGRALVLYPAAVPTRDAEHGSLLIGRCHFLVLVFWSFAFLTDTLRHICEHVLRVGIMLGLCECISSF